MIDFLEKIASALGAGALFRSYKHHLPRMGRVMLIGTVGFVIQTLIFEVLGIRLQIVAPSTATLIGAEFAILSNFFLINRYSFNDVTHVTSVLSRLARFHLVVCGSLVTQWLCVFIAEHMTEDLIIVRGAYLLGVGIGFIFNYMGYYLFVWRLRSNSKVKEQS